MREPLNLFAERIVRNGELRELLQGMIDEHGISKDAILQVATLLHDSRPSNRVIRRFPFDGTSLYDLRECGDKG